MQIFLCPNFMSVSVRMLPGKLIQQILRKSVFRLNIQLVVRWQCSITFHLKDQRSQVIYNSDSEEEISFKCYLIASEVRFRGHCNINRCRWVGRLNSPQDGEVLYVGCTFYENTFKESYRIKESYRTTKIVNISLQLSYSSLVGGAYMILQNLE